MAQLNFDPSSAPKSDKGDFSALPEGRYVAVAIASEMKDTKAKNGNYLEVTFEVIDGPYKGRKFWDRINIRNPNKQAQDIGQKTLANLCECFGITYLKDSAELHNQPVLAELKVKPADGAYGESNNVKKYHSINGHSPQAAPAAPQWAAAAGPLPAAAPQAAASTTPPWKR
jgi:hypothetical protein